MAESTGNSDLRQHGLRICEAICTKIGQGFVTDDFIMTRICDTAINYATDFR